MTTHRVAAHLGTEKHRAALFARRTNGYATPTDHRCRQLEWQVAVIMLAIAAILALPGNSFSNPAFAPFHRIPWMTEPMWAGVFGSVGSMRIVALIINGRRPRRTPVFRMLGAFFGFLTFGQFALIVTVGSVQELSSVPISLAAFAGLALSDAYSLFRASYDARYIRH